MSIELAASPRLHSLQPLAAAEVAPGEGSKSSSRSNNATNGRRSDASERSALAIAATTTTVPSTPSASASASASRQQIAETLQHLRAQEQTQRERELQRREAQDAFTKSIVKIMHLDTHDYDSILAHTPCVADDMALRLEIVTQQSAIAHILEQIAALDAAYQRAKKDLASIQDKKLRHERVQLAKQARDDALAPLREQLHRLDPTTRPQSAVVRDGADGKSKSKSAHTVLPTIEQQASSSKRSPSGTRTRKSTPPNYREVMEAIRKLQRERKTLADPYMGNLKLARLWRSINDHERALEDYTKASKALSDKQLAQIPLLDGHERTHVLEQQRLRRREALQFLFLRALQLQERKEAAALMTAYLELSLASERATTVAYLENLLRKQEYIEDPALATPDAVTQSILCTGSLGFLTDLRFELLQEMLAASPTDSRLVDAVARMHVRRRAYEPAKELSDRFVALPDVKRCALFASFAALE